MLRVIVLGKKMRRRIRGCKPGEVLLEARRKREVKIRKVSADLFPAASLPIDHHILHQSISYERACTDPNNTTELQCEASSAETLPDPPPLLSALSKSATVGANAVENSIGITNHPAPPPPKPLNISTPGLSTEQQRCQLDRDNQACKACSISQPCTSKTNCGGICSCEVKPGQSVAAILNMAAPLLIFCGIASFKNGAGVSVSELDGRNFYRRINMCM